MGAYTNPQAVVDKSGLIWANAIDKLSNLALKREEEEKKKTLEYNKDFAKKLERVTQAGLDEMSFIKQNAINAKVLNAKEMGSLTKTMEKKTYLEKRLLTATGDERTKINSQIGALQTQLMSYVTFKKTNLDATNDYLELLGGDISHFGDQGYPSLNIDNEYATSKMIDTGYLQGTKTPVYSDLEGWGYMYTTGGVVDDGSGKDLILGPDKTFTIYNTEDRFFNPTIIPETNRYYSEMMEKLGIIKNGEVQSKYLTNEGTTRTIDKKTGIQKVAWAADLKKIAATVNDDLNLQLGGRNGGGAYSRIQLKSIWQDTLIPFAQSSTDELIKGEMKDIIEKEGRDLKFDGLGGAMNENQWKIFQKMFKQSAKNFIPGHRIAVGEDNNIQIINENKALSLTNIEWSTYDGDGGGGESTVVVNTRAQGIVNDIIGESYSPEAMAAALNNYSMDPQGNSRVEAKKIDGDDFLIFTGLKDGEGKDMPHQLNISTKIGYQKALNEITGSKKFQRDIFGSADKSDDALRSEIHRLFGIRLDEMDKKRTGKITKNNKALVSEFNAYISISGNNPKYKTLSDWERAGKPISD